MAANLKRGKEDNNAFMACVLKVNIDSSEWRKIMPRLTKIQGVNSFRIDKDGMIELSGTMDSTLLLEMLATSKVAKQVKICWWQFGQCYSNLFILNEQKESSQCSCCRGVGCQYNALINGGNYGGDDQRYLHYGQYFTNRPKPKPQYIPTEQKESSQSSCCCRGGGYQYSALINGEYDNYEGDDLRYLHYDQYSANRLKPKHQYIPTEQKGSSQCNYCHRGECQYNVLNNEGYGNYGADDKRNLYYDRPKPKTQYQSFQKPSVLGEKAPTQTGEAVECCCLM